MSPSSSNTQQGAAVWDELAAVVGPEHVRPAQPGDAVDGVPASKVIEPGTEETLARVLASANRAALAVVPRGGGTKLDWGHPPRRADLVLSTTRLHRVLEHAWADLTATVEAGCSVARFQATLAEHGQRLAIDPLWPERATIGGILATGDDGPLVARFGSLRDLIIGVTLALPDGTLVLHSDVLGIDLRLEEGTLRFYDPVTEQKLLSHAEIEQALRAAEQARREAEERAGREEAARRAAEARIAGLEARLRAQDNT